MIRSGIKSHKINQQNRKTNRPSQFAQRPRLLKKPAKKRTTASSEPNADADVANPDSEVELDSLGSFFIHLIDNDYYQDDAEGSQADDVEVIILSYDSDPLPTSKIRRANRKVKFSHPLAYLDPNFLLKTQQHEARRTTRHSGQVVTSAGLPNTPFGNADQRSLTILTLLSLRRVVSVSHLTRLIQIIRVLPTHLMASHQPQSFHPSRQFLGESYL